MDDAAKRIADGLKKAMQAENEGYHFYKMAAQNTQDEKGREVFNLLAEEEMGHFEFLKGQYKSITETGKVDEAVKLGARKVFTESHPIFTEDIKDRIESAHYEMTALSIGAQLELSAVHFYKGEADAASDPAVKAFYDELAEWERGHYTALREQAEILKEEYWDRGGFSPF